jgi:SAM-dependent methyltransferase
MAEFDYQWQTISSPAITFTEGRVSEFLNFTGLAAGFFKLKKCLDAGCGSGRYTYALLQLGAEVRSIDISEEAIKICREINPQAFVQDLMSLNPDPVFDFVLSWGVLHHLKDPREGFRKVASQVRAGGLLHIMLYHRDTQGIYKKGRKDWPGLTESEKLILCKDMAQKYGGDVHGWWDAFNPKYNWGYKPGEIEKWFRQEGFKNIKVVQEYNINIQGEKN